MSVTDRVRRAINDKLGDCDLEHCAGGTVSVVVKLDAAGCPKRIAVRTEVEHEVEKRRPCAVAI